MNLPCKIGLWASLGHALLLKMHCQIYGAYIGGDLINKCMFFPYLVILIPFMGILNAFGNITSFLGMKFQVFLATLGADAPHRCSSVCSGLCHQWLSKATLKAMDKPHCLEKWSCLDHRLMSRCASHLMSWVSSRVSLRHLSLVSMVSNNRPTQYYSLPCGWTLW